MLKVIDDLFDGEDSCQAIDHLVITGASCRCPGLVNHLRDTYQNAHVHSEIAPEKAISEGAAKYAWQISESVEAHQRIVALNRMQISQRCQQEDLEQANDGNIGLDQSVEQL